MALVEDEAAVKGGAAEPVEHLLQPALLAAARADEGGIGEEEHALLKVLAEAPGTRCAIERVAVVDHFHVHTQVGNVALRVSVQVGGRGQPDVLDAAAAVVV